MQYLGGQWLSPNNTLQHEDYCIIPGQNFLALTLVLSFLIAPFTSTGIFSKPSFRDEDNLRYHSCSQEGAVSFSSGCKSVECCEIGPINKTWSLFTSPCSGLSWWIPHSKAWQHQEFSKTLGKGQGLQHPSRWEPGPVNIFWRTFAGTFFLKFGVTWRLNPFIKCFHLPVPLH